MGNYEVLCRLSTGGMAEIFLASKRGLAGFHKPVVLKKILPDIQGQEEFVQMFLDEAKVTAAFNHPHIAQVFDLDVAQGELFLAMEFVPGATLIEVARACRAANEPMPVGFGLAAVRDTALALHYAHTYTDPLGEPSPVIHRDVAEKNIMVTYEGVTKLLDFGIAKNLAGASRTQVGMVKGTSGYMSPEQIRGEPLDARSDLFSLGVVLHECLTGMRLFPGKAPMAVANAVLRAPIPEPSRVNKEIPPELDAIVLKALARRREDRHATTLEFARELERAVGPLIWLPEKSGELLRRLFGERREQTRLLLASGRAAVDSTGEVKLAQLFSDKEAPATPPPTPVAAPGVATPRTPTASPPPAPPAAAAPPRAPAVGRLPSISAPRFATPTVNSDQTEVVLPPSAARPPAPVAPPPPPESPELHRPALSPPPRDGALSARPRSLSRADAVPVQPAPKADMPTSVMRAPRSPTTEQPITASGGGASGGSARSNPGRSPGRRPTLDVPLPHLDAVTQPVGALAPSAPVTPPAPEDDEFPDDPTVPARRSPLARQRAVAPPVDEPEEHTRPILARPSPVEPEDEDGPEFLTAPYLRPPPARIREVEPRDEDDAEFLTAAAPPTSARSWQPEAEDDDGPEFPTAIITPGSARSRRQEFEVDPSERPTTPALAAAPPRSRRGEPRGEDASTARAPRSGRGRWVAALLLLLVLGGGAGVVALRLDGGLVSSRLFPPPPKASAPVLKEAGAEPPQAQAAPAAQPAPASAETPAAAPQEPPAAAATSTPDAGTSTAAVAAIEPTPTAVAEQGVASPEVKNEAASADTAPGATGTPEPSEDSEPVATRGEATAEPAQPVKRGGKATSSTRRKRERAPVDMETSPEVVTNPNEAERAWEALERQRSGAAEPAAGEGALTLATESPTKVYLGNRLLGETPLFRVAVPVGKQTLRLVGGDGKSLKFQVDIKAGEVTSVRVPREKLAKE
jgi:serine/threonine protein kinase